MKQFIVWLSIIMSAGVAVFSGAVITFDHFWQQWEFLAAAIAAIYNLFFAIFLYAFQKPPGGKTLHRSLNDGRSVVAYLLMRVSLPSMFFVIAMVVISRDRHHGGAPIPTNDVNVKLLMTLAAFVTVWLGDLLTSYYLRRSDGSTEAELRWVRHFRRHAWLVDLPLAVAYAGLTAVFFVYSHWSFGLRAELNAPLLLQAFVGGASALELLIQSAVHGFSDFVD
jgi:hypothetical protein